MRFNSPPGWPSPPAGWAPPAGWQPQPDWPPAPRDWQFWIDDTPAFAPTSNQRGFAVIDVETTGLSPSNDRIVEIALVRLSITGEITGEWSRRINPEGPVGATHIHGIRQQDVENAPLFHEIIPDLNARLCGLAVAAHNARFDLSFLSNEYRRAGWDLPVLPALCTLDASWTYLPNVDRRRLADCCLAVGIRPANAHSALGDAKATAHLLAMYMSHRCNCAPLTEHANLPTLGAAVVWPSAPARERVIEKRTPAQAPRWTAKPRKPTMPRLVELLDTLSLADAVDEGAPEGSLPYLELLAEVIEDGQITDEENAALVHAATAYDFTDEEVQAANRAMLLALAHHAMRDGKVSQAERAELNMVADLLRVDRGHVKVTLDKAETARQTRLSAGLRSLPHDWDLGEPLCVGHKVTFTGCDPDQRADLEQRAESLGVRVMNTVSRKTAVLVADGAFDGTKADMARELNIRTVHPDVFRTLLDYLQPA